MNFLGRRRILMTADAVGGVWTYALELCAALAPHDIKVVLATLGPRPTPTQTAAAARLENVELVCGDFRLEWMPEPWADVDRAGDWLLGLAATHAPDLVHLNGYAHAALPWRAPTLVVAHSCVLSWWRAVRGGAAPREWDDYRRRVQAGLQAAGMVIAPSRAMLAALVGEHGALPRAAVIPNARSAPPDAVVVKEPFVVTVGRLWDEAKNLRLLGQIASDLDWPVRAIGDATAPTGLSEAETDPVRGVELLGNLPEPAVRQWLQRATLYALPARYEPFGLSVLEAAQAGCALVLGDIPSLRENWDGAAAFAPANDPAAWRATLRSLARDPAERIRLAAAARRRSLEFSPERLAEGYLAAYARCFQSESVPA